MATAACAHDKFPDAVFLVQVPEWVLRAESLIRMFVTIQY